MASTNPFQPVADFRRSGERRIWLLIAAACTVPAMLSALQEYGRARLAGRIPRWQDLVFESSEWLFLGALTPITYYLGRRFPLRRTGWARTLAVHVAGALALCIGWASLGVLLALVLGRYPAGGPLSQAYLSWVMITVPWSVFMYFAVLGCVHAFSYFVEAREREAHASKLTAQLAEARMGALRMQLNPHFLFNSLNAVTILVRERNTPAASRVLELLSDVLRQVLRPDQPHLIPLAEELRFVEQYLAIEQVRFSDRLHVQWSIEDRAGNALVPSFLLQPLVENAIKHGLAKRAEAGRIAISARIIEPGPGKNSLELTVKDDGVGIAPLQDRQEGVGLSNTRERLRALYGDDATLTLQSLPSGGTAAILMIPFREENP